MTYDAVVIGGGIVGLCTAWQLQKRGAGRVALVEQFAIGHQRGSSHGTSRITRSTYHEPYFVQLMQLLHTELWPELEADLGQQVLYPNPGVFFGPPGGLFERHAEAVRAAGADVEMISRAEAQKRFPMFTFVDSPEVMHDKTGGLLAASQIVQGLLRWLLDNGVDVFEERPVTAVELQGDPVRVHTAQGILEAGSVAVCAGPWAKKLLPVLQPRITIARQDVGYFRLAGDRAQRRLGLFPVWVYLGPAINTLYYGLPEFGRPGVKAARHYVEGRDDDPDEVREPDAAQITALQAWMGEHFRADVEAVVATEVCHYTNTATEDLILDLHPDNPRVAMASGMSGHGFKLAPLSGRILAEQLISGSTTVEVYERHRGRFTWNFGVP